MIDANQMKPFPLRFMVQGSGFTREALLFFAREAALSLRLRLRLPVPGAYTRPLFSSS